MNLVKSIILVIPGEILSVKANEQKDMQAFEIQNGETNVDEAVVAFPMLGQIAYNELAKQVGAELSEKKCNHK